MKTLLQIVQELCLRTGLPSPTAVMSSTDDQIKQIVGLLNEGLDDLVVKYKWPQAQLEATFVSTAVESQGEMETIAPGYKSMIPNTFWSLTNKLPANGSITPADAQVLKIWGRPSALINFRIRNNELMFYPATDAGLSYRFEYETRYFVIDGDDQSLKQYFTKDTDTTLLPDNIHTLDLRWRWKCEKGLPYAENMRTFEIICKQAIADSAPATGLSLGTPSRNAMPGIVVPIGSWPTA